MKSRKTRLKEIVEILTHNNISSQEELLRHLATRGYIVTQATLSRDLKRLRTTKIATDMGNYRYVLAPTSADAAMPRNGSLSFNSPLHPAAVSVRFSDNIIVIKTRNGYASGIAYDLEMLANPVILGTIAGTDTVIAVVDSSASRDEVMEVFNSFFTPEALAEAY